jgi:hypothetical protein
MPWYNVEIYEFDFRGGILVNNGYSSVDNNTNTQLFYDSMGTPVVPSQPPANNLLDRISPSPNSADTGVSETTMKIFVNILIDMKTGYGADSTFIYVAIPISSNPFSNICFPSGTLITCNQGEIPIEQINPDIHTIRGKQIVAITKTNSTSKYLICFEKGSLGHNIPSRQTIMSENHQLIYNGKIRKALHFVDNYKNVNRINYCGETLYNILMKQHDTVMINNLICETLHPENVIAKIHFILKKLNPIEQLKFITKYNNKYIQKHSLQSRYKFPV